MHLMEDISPHSISSLMPGSLERDFDFFFFFFGCHYYLFLLRGVQSNKKSTSIYSLFY